MFFNYQIKKQNDINIISLEGELIEKTQAEDLLKDIEMLLENNELKIVLDLSQLKYVNSSGLNILINILTKCRKSGGDLAVGNLTQKVKELLVVTKLSKIFNVSENIEEAIGKLEKESEK